MRRLSYTALALVAAAACSEFHSPHFSEVLELVPAEKSVYVDVNGGDASIKVYSNGKVTARMLDEAPWATLMNDGFEGDGDVEVSLEANDSYRRMVQVEVALDGGRKLDTLAVYQYGTVPELSCRESYVALDGSAERQVSFPILTNISPDVIEVNPEYAKGESGWISDVRWEEGGIVSMTAAASSSDQVSLAVVRLSFPDGWKQKIEAELRVTRSGRSGSFGQAKTSPQVREMASEEGHEVEDDVFIEGLVISDCKSPNMELNPSVGYDEVDIEENARTAYIQSLDGQYGFRLKFDDGGENILVPGSQMKISLAGTVLTRESDPERYTISSVESVNMIGGLYNVPVPEKRKKISAIVPEDIYTFVTIEDTEFVNKGGSYTNVREDYSLPSDFNLSKVAVPMDGWASLLMDADGKGIYAMVGMMCPWRRTGDGVPQGSGTVSGIIVHHDNKRYGDMGDYQIRVLDESGFDMSDASAYSTYLKWSGKNIGDKKTYADPVENNTDGSSARLYLENEESSVASGTIRAVQSYDKLTTDGNSTVSGASIGLQVMLEGWYEETDGTMVPSRGLRAEFSTSGLSASRSMLAYISFCASGVVGDPSTFKNYPVHWCLEYSVDGENYTIVPPSVSTGKDYVHARTSPWTPGYVGSVKYYTSGYTGMGFTDHIFALPSEIMGKEKVYVRFRPYDTYMASLPVEWDGDIETAKLTSKTTYANDMRFAHIDFFVK